MLAKAMEKKETEVKVTEAFSKRPENANDFKPVMFKLKKRGPNEITGGKEPDAPSDKR